MNIESKRFKLTSTAWGQTAIHDKQLKTTTLVDKGMLPPVAQLAAMHEDDFDEAVEQAKGVAA